MKLKDSRLWRGDNPGCFLATVKEGAGCVDQTTTNAKRKPVSGLFFPFELLRYSSMATSNADSTWRFCWFGVAG